MSQRPPNGFAMVEMLMSLVISALAIGVAATLWAASSKTFRDQRLRNDQEALVDNDIATMEDLAYRYTCCPGVCTTNAGAISGSTTCRGLGGTGTPQVGSEYYYFPYYSPTATPTPAITNMENLCRDGTLVNGLVTALQSAPFTTPTGASLRSWQAQPTRTVVVDNPFVHRIRIDYSGNNLNRTTIIVPMVARWCP